MAKRASANNFLKLVNGITNILAEENGQIGNMQITGRLVSIQPTGDAIIVGDVHGDMMSLKTILENSKFMEKASKNEEITMIFLGDYGDRGLHSPEVYYIILKLKEVFPKRIILMKGNHEGPNDLLAHPHDLLDHLQRKFGDASSHTYSALRKLFDYLYNAVLIDKRYVLLHGGVPSQASTTEDLAFAHEKHPHETHLEEILWSDPREGIRGTRPSPRGAGRLFGEDITERLLRVSKTKVLIRGHEPSKGGFSTNHSEKILTLFSRKGPPYHNKSGAYLHLDLSEEAENALQLIHHIHKF
ncbi:MAG: serine/threonine protein phosphatase [Candidatus Bathyarchaeota archaeon]|nr:MAG: serine/threonine protein phosphatase [Candidatus Bathyarchaeota archaeon]